MTRSSLLANSSPKARLSAGYDQWLLETSLQAIRRSRTLLDQTEHLVRRPDPPPSINCSELSDDDVNSPNPEGDATSSVTPAPRAE